MSQHGGKQEAAKHRLALRLSPGFRLNLVPESILGDGHQVFGQLVHSRIPPLQHGLVELDNVPCTPRTVVEADVLGLIDRTERESRLLDKPRLDVAPPLTPVAE